MTELLAHLTADTEADVRAYLAELEVALAPMRANERSDALDDAEEFFAECLTADSTPADAALVARELGAPQEFAANMLSALGRRPRHAEGATLANADSDGLASRAGVRLGSGTVLGVPYDVRVPTASRVASRWWDPASPRVFVPRVWGVGWDLNFGAIAVMVGLIRPDDEDEPFSAVPQRAIAIALSIPVLLTLLILSLAVVFGSRLPAELPAHWNFEGRPDQFWSANMVLAFNLAMAGVPSVYAAYCVLAGCARLQQAAAIALASFMTALEAGIYLQTVLWGLGRELPVLLLVVLVTALALPFAVLTVLARIGRAHEWERDIPSVSREEL